MTAFPKVTNSTWVWSDTHFGHQNIIKFQGRPTQHEIIMLSEWARRVKPDDTFIHLGDVIVGCEAGRAKRWADILAFMPGKKFAILGNHDTNRVEIIERAGFTIIDPFIWKRTAFTHRPMAFDYRGLPEHDLKGRENAPFHDDDWDLNIHGHIHLNGHRAGEGLPLAGKSYVNMSVEAISLAPRQVGSLLLA